MKVKELNISANIAWSPKTIQPIYLVCGTTAQQYEASFNSSSALQIYDLNPKNLSLDMTLKISKNTPSKFNKILWNGAYNVQTSYYMGIIAGGCDNGSIYLYSPDKLFKNEDPLIGSIEGKHNGPIYAFDFNFNQPNLMASGSNECEIFIWDIKDTSKPMTPGTKPNISARVNDISWNKQVEHIMAATYGGRCVVYDLRKSASIIQISESVSRMKAHNVKWHPSAATQLILTSDDDGSPFGQVWDLRFATTPLKSLDGHQRGIAASAWCADDPDLFLTSGKENKILVWNPNHERAAEIVGEFPSYNQWSFDISWCQKDPSLVATSSIDGVVSVYSILGAGIAPSQSNKFSAIADSFPGMDMPSEVPQLAQPQSIYVKYPPKWLHRHCGAAFGFGGRLVSWNSKESSLTISQVITEPEFVQRSSQLEEALSSADLPSFCQSKVKESSDCNEKMLWSFLSASFESEPRTSYMNLLGFAPDQVASMVRPQDLAVSPTDLAEKISHLGPKTSDDTSSSLDPSEQFEMIASAHSADKTPEAEVNQDVSEPEDSLVLSVSEDTKGMIRHSLLLADYASAVELCLKERKHSLALIIAAHSGNELFKTTQDRVLVSEKLPGLSPLVTSIVRGDLRSLVSKCDLVDWKEALVSILTYASNEQMPSLIETLGERLEQEGNMENRRSAVLCFLCAGNIDKFISCLSKTRVGTQKRGPFLLLDLVEVMIVLERALSLSGRLVSMKEGSAASSFLCEYASLLASQGALSNAVSYLSNATEAEMVNLRDRLYRCLGYQTNASRTNRVRTASSSSHHSLRRTSTPLASQFSGRVQPQPYNSVPSAGVQQSQFFSPPAAPPISTSVQEPMNFRQPVSTVHPTFGAATAPPTVPPTPFYQPPPIQPQQPPSGPPPVGPQSGVAGFRKSVSSSRYSQDATNSYSSGGGGHPFGQSQGIANPASSMFVSPNVPRQVVQPNSHITPSPQLPPAIPTAPSFGNTMAPPNQFSASHDHITDHVTPAAYDPSVPRGWNDPPPLSGARKSKNKMEKKSDDNLSDQNTPAMPDFMVPEPPQQLTGFQRPGAVMPGLSGPPKESTGVIPPFSASAPSAPVPKKPIPSEHVVIHEVFTRLKEKGLHSPLNSAAKQRLQDVSLKLEILYDKLRENQIGANTLKGLHQMIEAIKSGDYYRALQIHAATISSGNFSEMSQFMPAVKILVTTCMQCQIFYQ